MWCLPRDGSKWRAVQGCRVRFLAVGFLVRRAGRGVALNPPCSEPSCAHGMPGAALQAELGKRLEAEVPRNHLDMRHRLDAQGNRYGKVIAYECASGRGSARACMPPCFWPGATPVPTPQERSLLLGRSPRGGDGRVPACVSCSLTSPGRAPLFVSPCQDERAAGHRAAGRPVQAAGGSRGIQCHCWDLEPVARQGFHQQQRVRQGRRALAVGGARPPRAGPARRMAAALREGPGTASGSGAHFQIRPPWSHVCLCISPSTHRGPSSPGPCSPPFHPPTPRPALRPRSSSDGMTTGAAA